MTHGDRRELSDVLEGEDNLLPFGYLEGFRAELHLVITSDFNFCILGGSELAKGCGEKG